MFVLTKVKTYKLAFELWYLSCMEAAKRFSLLVCTSVQSFHFSHTPFRDLNEGSGKFEAFTPIIQMYSCTYMFNSLLL